ncbi:hypothetical protein [Sphingomonas oligoaromativorans]|uniref:hypothetical protein n=1 Tax=Sphingomonas oligoaromativorans TaxID=575322 RepID=UPI001ABB0AB4|nr:hypothetical protein [Sphingomonas oligoaromativorans]
MFSAAVRIVSSTVAPFASNAALRTAIMASVELSPRTLPGTTETEFFDRAELGDTSVGTTKKDDPARVAKDGWTHMMKDGGDIVSGWKNKMQAAAAHVLPHGLTAPMHEDIAEPGSGERSSHAPHSPTRHAALHHSLEGDTRFSQPPGEIRGLVEPYIAIVVALDHPDVRSLGTPPAPG